MRVGLCQINTTVGDFDGNCEAILRAAVRARQGGATVAVFPELAVCGYPAEDLLLRPSFLAAHDAALNRLAANLPPNLCVLVGCLERNLVTEGSGGVPLYNAVARIEDGLPEIVARKSLLPTYDVFDECRFFEPWPHPEQNIIDIGGRRVGLTICEDGWNDAEFFTSRRYALDPVAVQAEAGVDCIINLSASPWARGRDVSRRQMFHAAAKRHSLPVLCVNLVGGNVSLQFDGGSLAAKPEGLAFEPVHFDEHVEVVDLADAWTADPAPIGLAELHYCALIQGIGDYGKKFGFTKAVLGLSGGIDSALTAVLAADALGPGNVVGIAMPSRYSSDHSREDAKELATNLGIQFHEIPIAAPHEGFLEALDPVFDGTDSGIAEENLQARSRGALLMAYANKFGHLLLTTGNKSEAAVGYCTLYGDMCGGLAVIADLWKTEVWALSRWINRDDIQIPVRSIEKPPSAELRPDQLDTDSLPEYAELDPVLRLLVEESMSVRAVAEQTGMPVDRVAELLRMVDRKRIQALPVCPDFARDLALLGRPARAGGASVCGSGLGPRIPGFS